MLTISSAGRGSALSRLFFRLSLVSLRFERPNFLEKPRRVTALSVRDMTHFIAKFRRRAFVRNVSLWQIVKRGSSG